MTLCNLTSNPETRQAATKGGGLQALVLVAKDADIECRRYATIALCNISNTPHWQVQVIVHGGLAPIMAMANSDDIDCQRHSIMAINNLAANEENHPTMFSKGVLRRLRSPMLAWSEGFKATQGAFRSP